MLIDDLALIAFEHRHVHELAAVAAVMLDDEETRRRDFEHHDERGDRA